MKPSNYSAVITSLSFQSCVTASNLLLLDIVIQKGLLETERLIAYLSFLGVLSLSFGPLNYFYLGRAGLNSFIAKWSSESKFLTLALVFLALIFLWANGINGLTSPIVIASLVIFFINNFFNVEKLIIWFAGSLYQRFLVVLMGILLPVLSVSSNFGLLAMIMVALAAIFSSLFLIGKACIYETRLVVPEGEGSPNARALIIRLLVSTLLFGQSFIVSLNPNNGMSIDVLALLRLSETSAAVFFMIGSFLDFRFTCNRQRMQLLLSLSTMVLVGFFLVEMYGNSTPISILRTLAVVLEKDFLGGASFFLSVNLVAYYFGSVITRGGNISIMFCLVLALKFFVSSSYDLFIWAGTLANLSIFFIWAFLRSEYARVL